MACRIREGDIFNSDEDIELDKPPPRKERRGMLSEPWALLRDAPEEIQEWAAERLRDGNPDQ